MDADAVEDELESDSQSVIVHPEDDHDATTAIVTNDTIDAWKQESVAENAQRLVTMCEEALQNEKDAQKQQYMQELQERVAHLLQTVK